MHKHGPDSDPLTGHSKNSTMRLTPQERTSLSLVLLIFILALVAYLLSKQGLYLTH
jgi:hypothetical protein